MKAKDDSIYLKHILEEIEKIENSLQDINKNEFLNNVDYQDMTVRRIEIIGEATKNISENLKKDYPEVQWREITRARDVIVHSYFKIDLDIIWDIVENNLSNLKNQIQSILNKDFS